MSTDQDGRSPFGRFGPTPADHPSIGDPCLICKVAIREGDVPTLISLAPADGVEDMKSALGRAYNAVAGVAHQSCAYPAGRVQ